MISIDNNANGVRVNDGNRRLLARRWRFGKRNQFGPGGDNACYKASGNPCRISGMTNSAKVDETTETSDCFRSKS